MTQKNKSNKILLILAVIVFALVLFVIISLFYLIDRGNNNLEQGSVIINNTVINIEVAQTQLQRYTGLRYRKDLKENTGMLFVFEEKGYYNFVMENMYIPLDMIWIADNEIVDITKNAPVQEEGQDIKRFSPDSEINYVLEVNAGFADKNNINIGDKVEINL